ncbi:MAG: hypothetical protein ACSHYF_14570 [Verrucomicrobiaceae bacterium]
MSAHIPISQNKGRTPCDTSSVAAQPDVNMKNYRLILPNRSDHQPAPTPTHERHVGFAKSSTPRPSRKIRLFPSNPPHFDGATSTLSLMTASPSSS